jgi:1-phosphatidylinositol phosphodiesterase
MKSYLHKCLLSIILIFLTNSVCGFSVYANSLEDAYVEQNYKLKANERWMLNINGETRLSQLSIPGTHNSMATKGNRWVQNQTMSLQNQLDSGIRYLDIRVRAIDGVFAIHHGAFFLDVMFGEVLNTVKGFLDRNPSETVLMRIKEEYKPVSNLEFNTILASYLNRPQYQGLFYRGAQLNPSLSEMRGKIVVLQDYSHNIALGTNIGLSWRNFNIQDNYEVRPNTGGVSAKWDAVRQQLDFANNNNGQRGVINHLSGTGILSPQNIANTINPNTYEYIKNNSLKHVGIVIADYPGSGLINQIIECNIRAGYNTSVGDSIKKIYITKNDMLTYINVEIDKSMQEQKIRYIVEVNGKYVAESYEGVAYYSSLIAGSTTNTLRINKNDLKVRDVVTVRLSSGTPGQAIDNIQTLTRLTITSAMLDAEEQEPESPIKDIRIGKNDILLPGTHTIEIDIDKDMQEGNNRYIVTLNGQYIAESYGGIVYGDGALLTKGLSINTLQVRSYLGSGGNEIAVHLAPGVPGEPYTNNLITLSRKLVYVVFLPS